MYIIHVPVVAPRHYIPEENWYIQFKMIQSRIYVNTSIPTYLYSSIGFKIQGRFIYKVCKVKMAILQVIYKLTN